MTEIFQLMADSPAFFVSFIFVLSLLVGSFLNVVIYRLPVMMENAWKAEVEEYSSFQNSTNQDSTSQNIVSNPTDNQQNINQKQVFNLVKPDSTCPKCQHKIRAWENIPVVSWLFLGGKCSQCKNPISIRYPLVELATGLLSALVAWKFGFGLAGLAAVLATWLLIAMTFIDLDTMLLPDQLTLSLLWIGLIISIDSTFVSTQDAIIGAAVGYLCLWSLYWAFKLLTGKEGMGYGDFKLLAAIGAWVGWQHLPVVVLLSSFVGAIVGITLLSIQGKDKSQPIPFGPYLATAGWLTLLYGDWFVDLYWQWLLP
ncbi:A24 family peptidase [Paraglaciecola aquimarina]|uniref:Prepilin leader peptidase/N-methyltransferase n=1 Tax=Paraglaciecola algarum TaxID=3050085 RepID=A0ABS9D6V8_9ALTE|nr:A24 family peptidase [Paraglaciecola sp. G1-23]MCF2948678.1 A24 family peptidase [Paraglaciecola sp. G1-23]